MRISIGTDNVNFKPVGISSLQEFVDYATQYNYSTGVFKDNYRKKSNFELAECIAIDVDNDDENDNYTIEDAKQKFAGYRHIIMPSKSHQKDKNGRVADRFRVILFLEDAITDAKDFTATWGQLLKFYPAADKACKDASRFYYPSPAVYSLNEDGALWPVTEYVEPERNELDEVLADGDRGQLSRETMHLLTYGAPAGSRNVRLFKAAKDMQEQGFSVEECKARVSSMISVTRNWETSYLNDKDIECIENAYKEEPKYEARPNTMSQSNPFMFKSLSDIRNQTDEVEWLVRELIPEAGFAIVSGKPKIGKSTLLFNLVKATLDGSQFLGREVAKGPVMLLAFEEHEKQLANNLELCGVNPGDENLYIHTGDVFGEGVFDHLVDWVQEIQPKLIVVDTIFSMSNIETINDYKTVYDELRRFRNLARETGSTVVGVHHNNKSGSFMGSQGIYGVVDTLISFVDFKDQRFIYSKGKSGQIPFNDQELLFDPATQSYTLGKVKERASDKL